MITDNICYVPYYKHYGESLLQMLLFNLHMTLELSIIIELKNHSQDYQLVSCKAGYKPI